jgi:hypothetical protein
MSATCQHTSAYVSMRQHTSAYVSIRQHTSAYVSIRQHTSAYGPAGEQCGEQGPQHVCPHTSAYVSTRQHTSAYGPAGEQCGEQADVLNTYALIRQHTSAHVSIRQHTDLQGSGAERRRMSSTRRLLSRDRTDASTSALSFRNRQQKIVNSRPPAEKKLARGAAMPAGKKHTALTAVTCALTFFGLLFSIILGYRERMSSPKLVPPVRIEQCAHTYITV